VRLEECLLHPVLRLDLVAEQPPAQPEHRADVAPHERRERLPVADRRPVRQLLVAPRRQAHGRHTLLTGSRSGALRSGFSTTTPHELSTARARSQLTAFTLVVAHGPPTPRCPVGRWIPTLDGARAPPRGDGGSTRRGPRAPPGAPGSRGRP